MIAWLMGRLWPIAGIAFVALGLWGSVQTARLHHTERLLADMKAAWATDRAHAAEVFAQAEEAARATEQAWQAKLSKVQDEAQSKITKARADAAIADAAAGRLSQRIAALVASAREAARNPQTTTASAAADDPAGMLSNVLGRCVERVRLLADYADQSSIAGKLCEQSYEALTVD